MVEIDSKNIYLYGKHYYPDLSLCPSADDRTNGIVIYTAPVKYEKDKLISSLEGLFICDEYLDNPMNNVIIPRKEMKEFSELHHGEFVTFKEHSPFVKSSE